MNQENNFNNQSHDKNSNKIISKKFGLIIGIIIIISIIGVLTINNSSNNLNSNNGNSEIVYYDKNRNINDNYTFKEAISKFAFNVGDSTLIFESNDKVSLVSVDFDQRFPSVFRYDNSLMDMSLSKSSSSTLQDFISNFNKGILKDNKTENVENVKIIESNNSYVFASWINKDSIITSYDYYYAKVIGDNVYYAYYSSLRSSDNKITSLLNQFKELFTCLSEDDGKEAYIQDKIINVPIVLNKKIKNYNLISSILNYRTDGGSVIFPSKGTFYVSLVYGADYYNRINWTETLNSSTKYAKEDNEIFFGIIDNGLTQVFNIDIYSNEEITIEKDFNIYINEFLINK